MSTLLPLIGLTLGSAILATLCAWGIVRYNAQYGRRSDEISLVLIWNVGGFVAFIATIVVLDTMQQHEFSLLMLYPLFLWVLVASSFTLTWCKLNTWSYRRKVRIGQRQKHRDQLGKQRARRRRRRSTSPARAPRPTPRTRARR